MVTLQELIHDHRAWIILSILAIAISTAIFFWLRSLYKKAIDKSSPAIQTAHIFSYIALGIIVVFAFVGIGNFIFLIEKKSNHLKSAQRV